MKLRREERRRTVLLHYSDGDLKCALCGEKHIEFLVLDHINNDGAEHRRTTKKVTDGLMRLLIKQNFPPGLRVLCQGCNAKPSLSIQEMEELIAKTGDPDLKYKIRRAKIRLKVLNHYGPVCKCCNNNDVTKLTVDHVNGGGRAQFREDKLSAYQWTVKNNFPDIIRILCVNCNHSYGAHRYCPHQLQDV
jgi:hypothetical protein